MQIVEKPVQHHVQRQRPHAVYGAQSSDEVMPVAATDLAAEYAVCCRTTFRGLFQKTPVDENNVARRIFRPDVVIEMLLWAASDTCVPEQLR